jgi:DNA-binding transcriptional regulator GbsR (MarR family)
MSRDNFEELREEFVGQWGTLGASWGINRSMAQIHAHLLVAQEPLCTDDLMEDLALSRGNANTNLRELVSWGLVRQVPLKGERRQYFEAENSVWKIVCIVARERKRRELEPTLALLKDITQRSKKLKGANGKTFHKRIARLAEFLETGCKLIDKVVSREESQVVPALLKLFR